MKRTLLAFFALCFLSAVSCQKEQLKSDVKDESKHVTMHAEACKNYIDSENAIIWGTSEFVTMYYNDGEAKFAQSEASSADKNNGLKQGQFDFSITPSTAISYTIGGVYPSSAVVEEATKCKVAIPSEQNATASSYDPAAYVMVIKPEVVSEIPSEWTASFRRASALNKITLTGVQADVKYFEIETESALFGGEAIIDLSTGETESYSKKTNVVAVKYATALPAGNMDIWFTSWDAVIPANEKVKVTAYTATGYYQKEITAKAGGIIFSEGNLNKLSVDFSSVTFHTYTIKDFAQTYVKGLEKWENTTTTGETIGNVTVKGHYIPHNFIFEHKGMSLTKAQAYDFAVNAMQNMYNDSNVGFSSELQALKGYVWVEDAFNENAGRFENIFVNIDLLRNFTYRANNWQSSHSHVLPTSCGYTNDTTTGEPSIKGKGYKGTCCLERHNLMMMRLYKYLLDEQFESDLAAIESNIHINSSLYEETELYAASTSMNFSSSASSSDFSFTSIADWTAVEDADWITISKTSGEAVYGSQSISVSVTANSGSSRSADIIISTKNSTLTINVSQDAASKPSIKEFAEEYVKLLSVWETTIVNMPAEKPYCAIARNNVHSIPMDSKITVKGSEYTISQMLEVAMRSYLLLIGKDGNDAKSIGAGKFASVTPAIMSSDLPGYHTYGINYWYLDNSNNGGPLRYQKQACKVTASWLTNYSERNVNFANNNSGAWGNFAGYNGGQLTNYTGLGTPGRAQIALIRMFKMLLDDKIESGVAAYLADKEIDSTLYGNETYD